MTSWLHSVSPRWRRVMLVVPFMIMIGLVLAYTNYVERQADRRWCDLLEIINTQSQLVPPTTEIGRQIAEAIHELTESLDC